MIQLITNTSDLRHRNIVFVDSIVIPPNFITASPRMIEGQNFDWINAGDFKNIAYFNLNEDFVKHAMKYAIPEFNITPIRFEDFNTLPEFEIRFEANSLVINFAHQLQNYYFDWTGRHLIPISEDAKIPNKYLTWLDVWNSIKDIDSYNYSFPEFAKANMKAKNNSLEWQPNSNLKIVYYDRHFLKEMAEKETGLKL